MCVYLVAKAVKAKVVVLEDLGMEAIYEFEVEDMPVTVAVDSNGANAHQIGPDILKVKIRNGISVRVAIIPDFNHIRCTTSYRV